MTLISIVEDISDGRVAFPAIPETWKMRTKDPIELHTPDGRVLQTHIAGFEFVRPEDGGPCRILIILPPDITKQDVPAGTEVWLA